MLQAANTDQHQLVPKAHNSECQHLSFSFANEATKKSAKANWRIFRFFTLGTNGLRNELGLRRQHYHSSAWRLWGWRRLWWRLRWCRQLWRRLLWWRLLWRHLCLWPVCLGRKQPLGKKGRQGEKEAHGVADERDVKVLRFESLNRLLLSRLEGNSFVPELLVQPSLVGLKNQLLKDGGVWVVLKCYEVPVLLIIKVNLLWQGLYISFEAKSVKVGFPPYNLVTPLSSSDPVGLLCTAATSLNNLCQFIIVPSPCKRIHSWEFLYANLNFQQTNRTLTHKSLKITLVRFEIKQFLYKINC